jgi:hypothetical protein
MLVVLIVLNVIVLTGQIWPAGAPAFAPIVNIVFLIASLAVFTRGLLRPAPRSDTPTARTR